MITGFHSKLSEGKSVFDPLQDTWQVADNSNNLPFKEYIKLANLTKECFVKSRKLRTIEN